MQHIHTQVLYVSVLNAIMIVKVSFLNWAIGEVGFKLLLYFFDAFTKLDIKYIVSFKEFSKYDGWADG